MMELWLTKSPSDPNWDGSRVFFEITEGRQRVSCAISRTALEDIGERRLFTATDVLGCFAKVRARIETIALKKLHGKPDSFSGRLNLWADDVDGPPTDGFSSTAHHEVARLQSA